MFQKFGASLMMAVALIVSLVGNAAAEFTYTAPTIDIATVGTMVTGILAGLALMWGVRKAIKTVNRS